jgi:hypothetical protein
VCSITMRLELGCPPFLVLKVVLWADWAGNKRKLRVTAQPNVTLTTEHVPCHCMRARTLLLGPLTPEDLDSPALTNMPQGESSMSLSLFPPL